MPAPPGRACHSRGSSNLPPNTSPAKTTPFLTIERAASPATPAVDMAVLRRGRCAASGTMILAIPGLHRSWQIAASTGERFDHSGARAGLKLASGIPEEPTTHALGFGGVDLARTSSGPYAEYPSSG